MAIYHASQKPIKRSAGRSSVAAAAYRSGSRLLDDRTGLVHDYRAKAGVVSTDMILPNGQRLDDARRADAWSQVEKAEKRKDACTAWEWTLAAPDELDRGQQRRLGVEFGQRLADKYGVMVDVALHSPDKEGDNRNWHYHVTRNTRLTSLDESGQLAFGRKADPDLSGRDRGKLGLGRSVDEVHAVRQMWCDLANAALERAGSDARIDHRSLKDQGIDREPTKHLGPHASAMKRKGLETDRDDMNIEAHLVNEIVQIKAARDLALRNSYADDEAVIARNRAIFDDPGYHDFRQWIDAGKPSADDDTALQKAARMQANRVAEAEQLYADMERERTAEAAHKKTTDERERAAKVARDRVQPPVAEPKVEPAKPAPVVDPPALTPKQIHDWQESLKGRGM